MSSSPYKASKITGAGPIFEGPSGYFARGRSRSEVGVRLRQRYFPHVGMRYHIRDSIVHQFFGLL